MFRFPGIFLCMLLPMTVGAARLKILTIGDSLSKEYQYEVPFSAPEGSATANTKNWVETMTQLRSTLINFGDTKNSSDLRVVGHEYNFSIPGHTAAQWAQILSNNPKTGADIITNYNLVNYVEGNDVSVVVIFLGGNDLDNDYGAISKNATPPASLAAIRNNIASIHDYLRSYNATIPIVICTVPDVGATYEVAQANTTPAEKATARQRTAALNADIMAMAATRNAKVARIDKLTDRLFDEHPFTINGTEFIYPPDTQNEKHRLFCRDGFHPGAAVQALVANEIIMALNQATTANIPLLGDREILSSVLSFNPDQPYLTWAGSNGGMLDNPDGDGLPNLAEYLFGTQASKADSPFTYGVNGTISFTPQASALQFASLTVEESTTLKPGEWTTVPSSRISIGAGGQWTISPSNANHNFYRLAAEAKP